jgi:hypothetical protein
MFQAGVRLLVNRVKQINNQQWLCINSGTNKATDLHDAQANQQYCDYAYVPKNDWRSLICTESSVLFGEEVDLEPGAWVGIFTMPALIMQYFDDIQYHARHEQRENVLLRCDPVSLQHGVDLVKDYIRAFDQCNGAEFHTSAISIKPANALTVTYDERNQGYVGLHVDSFYGKKASMRNASPNRVCVNIGPDYRYLLFINISLPTMLALVGEAQAMNVNELIRKFMMIFPNYPVLRVMLAPGEAYIAPTETIVHDASTMGTNHADVSMHIRGLYRYPKEWVS